MWISKSLALMSAVPTAMGLLQVPQWISDGMVLQTSIEGGPKASLNGMSDAGGSVTVQFSNEKYTAVADSTGHWSVQLNPDAEEPGPVSFSITNEKGESIQVSNAIYGDVYFCSGQSNMVFPVENAINATEEAATLALFPHFNFFKAITHPASAPQDMLKGSPVWVNASSALANNASYVEQFSAICYMTAREISRLRTGTRPVGLVESAVGATRVESWMPESAFSLCPKFPPPVHNGTNAASALYNGMVHPFNYMAVRGAFWYQGERNAKEVLPTSEDKEAYYACMYQAMISSWRELKNIGDFGWVTEQLPPSLLSGAPNQQSTGWIPIRLAQAKTLPNSGGTTKNAGVAIGIDLGGISAWGSLHPADKNMMSRRMALQAVHAIFNVTGRMSASAVGNYLTAYDSYWSGPVFKSAEVTPQGVEISFQDTNSLQSLRMMDVNGHNANGTINPCTLCCAKSPPFEVLTSGNWKMIPLSDISIKSVTVTLTGGLTDVTAVRYANSDYVECALVNGDSLPLGPFSFNVTQ
eukprot:TRINITY_DN19403_c0_g1_i1.p1 TRINITY_DN19403_c0_g1~~TRINITY_DN19403_c0_g1_i1.p1  ORF type:complete len:541 (+),score=104.64 TRINITY_DN19403_c0_g1_i1:47-1624(+)